MKNSSSVALILVILFILGCGIADHSDGSGSQTTNGITVSAAADSLTVSAEEELTVHLFSSGYNPLNDSGYHHQQSLSDGGCQFKSLTPGYYTLLIQNNNGDSSAIFQNITIDDHTRTTLSDMLRQSGTLSGILVRNNKKEAGSHIYIRGTPFAAISDPEGAYHFPQLPQGSHTLSVRFSSELPNNDIDYPEKVVISPSNQEQLFNIIIIDE